MIHYAGLFSNRWRKQYLAQSCIALNQSEDIENANFLLQAECRMGQNESEWAEWVNYHSDMDYADYLVLETCPAQISC
jgi:hypothetical protein